MTSAKYDTTSSNESITFSSSSSSSAVSSSNSPLNENASNDNKEKKNIKEVAPKRGCSIKYIQFKMHQVVTHWIFESFIIFCILCSSIALVSTREKFRKEPRTFCSFSGV